MSGVCRGAPGAGLPVDGGQNARANVRGQAGHLVGHRRGAVEDGSPQTEKRGGGPRRRSLVSDVSDLILKRFQKVHDGAKAVIRNHRRDFPRLEDAGLPVPSTRVKATTEGNSHPRGEKARPGNFRGETGEGRPRRHDGQAGVGLLARKSGHGQGLPKSEGELLPT